MCFFIDNIYSALYDSLGGEFRFRIAYCNIVLSSLAILGCHGQFDPTWKRKPRADHAATEPSTQITNPTPAAVYRGSLTLTGVPTGTSRFGFLSVTAGGTKITAYKYKVGVASTTDCSSETGYSAETKVAVSISDIIASLADGLIKICAVGKDDQGVWQPFASATSATWTKTMTPTVAARYAAAPNWNYYVTPARNYVLCDYSGSTDVDCIHGGEQRMVYSGMSSCTGLSISDSLGVFDWTCAVQSGEAVFTSLLKEGKGLRDLVTHGNPKGRWNAISVTISGTNYGTARTSDANTAWWGNSVEALADSSASMVTFASTDSGKIFTANSSFNSKGVSFGTATNAAIVFMGSITVTSTVAGNNCLGNAIRCIIEAPYDTAWIEGGTLDGVNFATTLAPIAISVSSTINIRGTTLLNARHGIAMGLGSAATCYMCTFSDMTIGNMNRHGIYLTGDHNILKRIKAYSNGWDGINLDGFYHSLQNIYAANNSNNGVYINNGESDILADLVIYNNIFYGLRFGAKSGSITNVVAANNNLDGIKIDNGTYTSGVVLTRITAMNNVQSGIMLSGSTPNVTFLNVISANNTNSGISTLSNFTTSTMAQFVSTNNGQYGFDLSSGSNDNNALRGNIFLGSNTSGNCTVSGTGNNFGTGGVSCSTGSGGTEVATAMTIGATITGRATSDSSNTHAVSLAYNTPITDFINFESVFRGWGIDGGGFPVAGNRGRCSGATVCRIFDAALKIGDTLLLNRSGNGTSANQTFTAGSACPTEVNGNRTITSVHTTPSTFLANAVEINTGTYASTTGNHNGLCETGETCLYTPNYGAYQGDGALGTCTFSSAGGLTGITMYGYATNLGH